MFAVRTIDSLPITAKTRQNYRGAYQRHLAAPLAHRQMSDITRQHLREILAPLPPPTAYQTLMVAKTVFREAIDAGLLDQAPTDRLRTARVQSANVRFLTWDEIASTHFGRYTNQVRFLALHGLRWGEAAALTEGDIWDDRVHVTKSIHGAPKSAAGVRDVPHLGFFERFSHDRRGLARALKPHGVTIHSLRHTYAYLLKTSGVHVTTAQHLLGHASVQLTLSIYTAVLNTEVEQAGDQLRAVLGSALGGVK